MPTDDHITTAEVARRLDRFEGKLDRFYGEAVLRAEFEARLVAHDREIRDLKQAQEKAQDAQKARQPQWTAVAAVVIAALALLVTLVPPLAGG